MAAKRITLSGNYIVDVKKGRKTINIYKAKDKNNKRLYRVGTDIDVKDMEHVLAVYAKQPKSYVNIMVALMAYLIHNDHASVVLSDERCVNILKAFTYNVFKHTNKEPNHGS